MILWRIHLHYFLIYRIFQEVLTGYKENGVSAVWRLDFVVVSNEVEGLSSTVLLLVDTIGVNPFLTSEAAVLGERIARGDDLNF
ncbi:MAG: hypothetical protein AYP45_08135 [Candidatus Brocadia carolinensis]|uniref:Uncharacterized protein n=1 Tax=Candidatus Brocadia carolinensis TaxID=1004156 RepID=A0A1V4ATZ2_9BACT|nr:MAG: hypothetical protein AYP45_08135 [Candidatus Brocadia caroliniensis]